MDSAAFLPDAARDLVLVHKEGEAAVVREAASVDGADPGVWASGSGDAEGASLVTESTPKMVLLRA